ncbi:MAG: Gfo/Idh/MocA family oxidoreductase [Bryobacteraceae bacterium]|nr:Gfo/Idh/MocA family oxidoreductase [Bryobacteraceae bacterium]
MNPQDAVSRRSFLGKTAAAAPAAFAIVKPNLVRGQGKEKLKAGLIGCGGRGTQAVQDLLAGTENVELVAMADVFEDKLEGSLRELRGGDMRFTRYAGAEVIRNGKVHHLTEEELRTSIPSRVNVGPGMRFVGQDAYKKLLATDIDIVMLATPPGYRPLHLEAAIDAKKHVFCEKPFGTDPVGVRRAMAAARKSEDLRLTVVTGAQRRFQRPYVETVEKIQSGAIGDIVATYAYWVGTPVIQVKARDPKWSDAEFQHRSWYSFVWICGDQIVEQHLHNIDVCNWVMGMHPVKVRASGGAAWRPREEIYGNIYDHISAEYEYPNGVIMSSYCRQYRRQPGTYMNVSELVVGTKGRSNCQDMGKEGNDPYMQEHIAMVDSIRGDGPYINHAMAVAESTMTCIMGREAAYSGREITWNDIMMSQQDLMPKDLSDSARIPVPPLPVPGEYKFV